MKTSPELVERFWAELRACVDAEVRVWSTKKPEDILRALEAGPRGYQVDFGGSKYDFVADLLDDADTERLTVMLEAQPADPSSLSAMARPRNTDSGGWTNDEMGLISEIFRVPRYGGQQATNCS